MGNQEVHVRKAEISGIAPYFFVKNVSVPLSFYRDRLGFEITFQGIVRRGAAMIMTVCGDLK
jgi:hypothetical protein